MGNNKAKTAPTFGDTAKIGNSSITGDLTSSKEPRNELREDADKLLRITFPETFIDPSKRWSEDLLRVDINFEEAGLESSSFIERINEFMYRSVRTICTEGEAEKFSRDEWEQLVSAMTLTALSEDEIVAPLLTVKIREWLKEVIRKYVAEDNFILETMEMIAAIRLQDGQTETNKPESVFIITEGRVVKDETAIPAVSIEVLESESVVKVLKEFVEEKKNEIIERTRNLNEIKRVVEAREQFPILVPENVFQASNNAINALRRAWA
jgi:hypothetical protein